MSEQRISSIQTPFHTTNCKWVEQNTSDDTLLQMYISNNLYSCTITLTQEEKRRGLESWNVHSVLRMADIPNFPGAGCDLLVKDKIFNELWKARNYVKRRMRAMGNRFFREMTPVIDEAYRTYFMLNGEEIPGLRYPEVKILEEEEEDEEQEG